MKPRTLLFITLLVALAASIVFVLGVSRLHPAATPEQMPPSSRS